MKKIKLLPETGATPGDICRTVNEVINVVNNAHISSDMNKKRWAGTSKADRIKQTEAMRKARKNKGKKGFPQLH
jgi:hypothetical protein